MRALRGEAPLSRSSLALSRLHPMPPKEAPRLRTDSRPPAIIHAAERAIGHLQARVVLKLLCILDQKVPVKKIERAGIRAEFLRRLIAAGPAGIRHAGGGGAGARVGLGADQPAVGPERQAVRVRQLNP